MTTTEPLVRGKHFPNEYHLLVRKLDLALAKKIRFTSMQPKFPSRKKATFFLGYYKRYYNWTRVLREATKQYIQETNDLIFMQPKTEMKVDMAAYIAHNPANLEAAFIQDPED